MRVTLIDLWGREGMLHYGSQLANSLARLPNVQVTVLLPKGSDVDLFAPLVSIDYVDVVRDTSVLELLSVPMKLLSLPRFFETIRRTRPDIVHLNNCHVWYIATLPWMRRRYPIVSTIHDIKPHPGQDDSWRKQKEIDTLARLSHHIFVHGENLKRQLLMRYPTRTKDEVTVIPLGELTFFSPHQNEMMEDSQFVLFFGRIRAYKGLEYFIEAAKLVAQRIPDARFVIAGAGDLQPYRKLFTGETRFEIHNRYIPDDEVARFFVQASIVVLPYVEASQSAVIPIAYAFKKPVITTSVGCLPDVVVEGQTGLIVPPHDVPALAEAMLRLLNDDELREILGRNAHHKMRDELGWDKIASTTYNTYKVTMQGFELNQARG